MKRRARFLALALLTGLLACQQADGFRLNPLNPKVDPKSERELGYRFDQEVRARFTLIDDPVVLGYLNDLGRSIVEDLGPQPFVYRFRVLPDPQLNAFAVPGGFLYFHSGTLLGANHVDELAGVMAHEIGHVKGRHWARATEKAALPNLLTMLGGIAAAAATGEPGFAVAAQAANVAMQIQWTREYEAEADQLAVTFMRRSGYDPDGLARFFERLIRVRDADPIELPPYLYTHPQVEDRIDAVRELADATRPQREANTDLARRLRPMQARLDLLMRRQRTTLPPSGLGAEREKTDPLLAWADRLIAQGDREAAVSILLEAEEAEPRDPRVPFRRAELLAELDRPEEAIAAWRRTLELDPTRALLYFKLGGAYKARGDAQRAVYYYEQAGFRFAGGDLKQRAEWEVVKLTFPALLESGLGDGRSGRGADSVGGMTLENFDASNDRVVWWGRVAPRFLQRRDLVQARWKDPDGAIVFEGSAETKGRYHVLAVLPLSASRLERRGTWRLEAHIEDHVIDTRTFRVQ